jgi:MOSC domain-containing protein YiiM
MEPTVPPASGPTAHGRVGRARARTGRVLAVCAGRDALAKAPLAEARVTRFGIPGDVHFGETMTSPQGPVPNVRPITAVGVEAVGAAAASLGIEVPPGGLGENLLLDGLGDLADLAPGDLLRVGSSVVLEVAKQNAPCKRLCSRHPGLRDALVGRRGLICTVRAEGAVRPGDRVEVVPHPSAG